MDWELADVGDPAWDRGSVLAQWLSALGAPPLQAPLARRGAASEDVTIAHVRAASRAFWDSYCERAGADDENAGRLLRASIRCAGARLVQIGYEEQQAAVRLRPRTRVLVGLARDVLLRPERTAGALLGSAPWATGSFAPPLPLGRAFAA